MDDLNSIHFAKFAAAAWSETQSVVISAILTFCIGILGIQLRFTVAPGLILFALACAPQFTRYMSTYLEVIAEIQRGMTAVQRLDYYRNNLPHEGQRTIPDAVGSDWPTDGSIELVNVSMRYRPDLPLSLHNINLSIRSGE